MRLLRKTGRPQKILRYVLLGGGFLLLSTIAPIGGARLVTGIIKAYFRKKRFEKEKFLRDLKNLQTRKLIEYQELPNKNIKIVLTKAGEQMALMYNLETLELNSTKHWDGEWRMIIFDIPHNMKKARDAFRQKLKQLHFYPIQKSVFIAPYECEKEIDFISSIFEIRKYILILYVSHFEGEKKLRHYFKV